MIWSGVDAPRVSGQPGAHAYQQSAEPIDDLVQVASLAQVKAIDRFDASHFRDRTWTVRPPRALQELTLRLERAVTRLSASLDRAPTVKELAADLGSDEEQILEALQARAGRAGVSLDAPRSGEDDEQTLHDTLDGPDDGFRLAESRVLLEDLTAGLSARSRERGPTPERTVLEVLARTGARARVVAAVRA